MSEHSSKGHTIAAFIMVLIIAGLATWGFGLMNGGDTVSASVVGVLLFAIGAYAVLGLGKD